MKRLIYTFIVLVSISSINAQKRTIDIRNFTGIDLSIPGLLYIQQGDKTSLQIECSDDALDKIEFEMRGDRLKIRNKGKGWSSWRSDGLKNVKVYVTMRDIEQIGVSGSGDIFGEGIIKAGNIGLNVSGSGYMRLALEVADLDVSISGSGRINLEGNGNDMDLDISGSGSVSGAEFKITSLDASISGSGKCEIEVTDSIDANISGSGSVYYKGNPEKIRSNSSGSGKVKRY